MIVVVMLCKTHNAILAYAGTGRQAGLPALYLAQGLGLLRYYCHEGEATHAKAKSQCVYSDLTYLQRWLSSKKMGVARRCSPLPWD